MTANKFFIIVIFSLMASITLLIVVVICFYFYHDTGSISVTRQVNQLSDTSTMVLDGTKKATKPLISDTLRKLSQSLKHLSKLKKKSQKAIDKLLQTKKDSTKSETSLTNTTNGERVTLTMGGISKANLSKSLNWPKYKSKEKEKINNTTLEKRSKIDLNVVSGLSNIKTSDLTEIYQFPSNRYQTVNDVLTSLDIWVGDLLGKGSYASVYKAGNISGESIFACKVINITTASPTQSVSLKSELFIMGRVRHPNIIKLHRHFIIETASQRWVYIIMDYAEGDSLSVFMRKGKRGQPEAVCKRWFAQMVSAVKQMHTHGIAHRDLKMGNILLDKNFNCLVTDFGLSRVAYRQSKGGTILSNKFCGTVPYMAPEVLINRHYQLQYDPFMADVWALGVVLFCILNRSYPFVEGPKMYDQQMAHKIRLTHRMSFQPGKDLIDLINRILQPDVSKRATIEDLMQSPWAKEEMIIAENNAKEMNNATKEEKVNR